MADDRITAELDAIAGRFAARVGDAERLIAVARMVAARHQRSDGPNITQHICADHGPLSLGRGPDWRAAVEACPRCVVTEKYVCKTCRHECPDDDEWPCAEHRELEAALFPVEGAGT